MNNKIDLYYKYIGLMCFVCIMGVLGYFWDFRPVKSGGPTIISGIYNAQLVQVETEYQTALSAFPQEKDFDGALESVKKNAENNHLKITLRKSGTVIQRDFYSQIPVQIILVGTYQQILDFMIQSARASPVFIWKSWVLSHQYPPKTTVLNETENNDLLQLQANTEFFYVNSPELGTGTKA